LWRFAANAAASNIPAGGGQQQVNAPRRIRRERSETITMIFAATRQLMLDEGYAAVTTRRVAKVAGLTSALVHYYFATTDDLIVALYRKASEDFHLALMDVANAERPIEALWALYTDAQISALGVEFMAMANHRKALQAELVRLGEHSRRLTEKIIAPALRRAGVDPAQFPDFGVTTLIQGVARTIVMDRGVGMSLGVADASAIMERLIGRLAAGEPAKD
jgi:AcrR family transcriptional regulator